GEGRDQQRVYRLYKMFMMLAGRRRIKQPVLQLPEFGFQGYQFFGEVKYGVYKVERIFLPEHAPVMGCHTFIATLDHMPEQLLFIAKMPEDKRFRYIRFPGDQLGGSVLIPPLR